MAGTYVHGKELRDLKVTKGTGLTVGIASGNYNISGIEGYYSGTTNEALTNNATNYVEMDSTGTIVVNTSAFTNGYLHLATVVTSGGVVSSIVDARTFVSNSGAAFGTAIWRSGDLSSSIDGVNVTFTLPTTPDANSLILVLDGSPMHEGAGNDYTISGNTITFLSAPLSGSKLIYKYTQSTPVSPAATDGLLTSTGTVSVGLSAAPSTKQALIAIDANNASWQNIHAHGLISSTGNIDVSASSTPNTGQTLRALNATNAAWGNPSLFLPETVSGTTKTVVANTSYIANNASQVVFTLPVSPSVGDAFMINGLGAGGWRVSQNAGQKIIQDTSSTTTGITGYIASTYRYNSVMLIYLGSNTWKVCSKDGTLTIA